MSETIKRSENIRGRANDSEKTKRGILSYGTIQSSLFAGAERVDARLRKKAKKRNPKSRNRRPGEVIYQWTAGADDAAFQLRLYTSIETGSLITRAERTGRANLRITVRDNLSKKPVGYISDSLEIERGATDWQTPLRQMLERAFLFCWQKRPVCFGCRRNMEIRIGRSGEFWGCTEFPKCNTTLGIRNAENDGKRARAENSRQPEKSNGKNSKQISEQSEIQKPDQNRRKTNSSQRNEVDDSSADADESPNENLVTAEIILDGEFILDVEPLIFESAASAEISPEMRRAGIAEGGDGNLLNI